MYNKHIVSLMLGNVHTKIISIVHCKINVEYTINRKDTLYAEKNMYILESVLHKTVWGGNKFSKALEKNAEKSGHLYMVNGHKNMSNRILNGIYKGKKLSEVFQLQKKDWNLDTYHEFPLTISLIDASQHLSIQVHPDDVIAEKLEGEKIGKTESWLFLEAPSSGWIYDGCCCETIDEFKAAVAHGRIEEVAKHFPIMKNDYVYVEAGTLHGITAGSLVCEIGYGSDFTYRFYDYGRKNEQGNQRELHIDKAMQAIKTERSSVKKTYKSGWISEKNYEICIAENLTAYKNSSKEIECISVLCGTGSLEGNPVGFGTGILLLPGEQIEDVELKRAVIARIRR